MATAGLDQSLDQIMQSRPKGRRGGSGRRASAPASTGNAGQNARQRYSTALPDSKRGSPAAAGAAAPAQSIAQKIMVSGLPPDQKQALVKSCYAPSRSHEERPELEETEERHFAVYLAVPIVASRIRLITCPLTCVYSERPMKIEIVMDPSKVPPPSLASRVAPAPAAKQQQQPTPKAAASGAAPERSGKPAGGRGRGRRRKGGNDRPAKSAADLDAEMEVYKATPDEAAA
ncbi:hypothetical protein FRC06_002175 [Ceratobasidium sp. 370]|nr:hypothetical protein FRC06_002175 [Ceratobasidium sp. 370]